MKARLLLVRDGLEGAIPSMAHVLRDAGLSVSTVSGLEMPEARSADVVELLAVVAVEAVAVGVL